MFGIVSFLDVIIDYSRAFSDDFAHALTLILTFFYVVTLVTAVPLLFAFYDKFKAASFKIDDLRWALNKIVEQQAQIESNTKKSWEYSRASYLIEAKEQAKKNPEKVAK